MEQHQGAAQAKVYCDRCLQWPEDVLYVGDSGVGMQIGRDVELVCFSDFDSPLLESSPVRLVAQPVDELGKMAGEEILRRIKDRAAEQKQILLSSIYLGVLSRHSQ